MTTQQAFSIQLNGVSKKFGTNWIFKNVSADFKAGTRYAVTGPNGSGKSTLLKIVAGIITPNAGMVKFGMQHAELGIDDVYQHLAFCAPFMELPEEMTLAELLGFHGRLRTLTISAKQFIELVQIEPDKEIRNYSSGMKQRVKLALAFYTQTQAILLDEPTSNLDEHWTSWYLTEVQKIGKEKLLIISSNHLPEYSFCEEVLDIGKYKPQ